MSLGVKAGTIAPDGAIVRPRKPPPRRRAMSETLSVEGIGSVELAFTERGSGQPVLLLHGGAGPLSVAAWGELLARTRPARVIVPTHPGFNGSPRPEALTTVAGLARVYAAFLAKLGLEGVTVIGNSV